MPARAQSPSTPNRPQLRDGILQLSEQPGLGWELDEDFIDRYRVSFA